MKPKDRNPCFSKKGLFLGLMMLVATGFSQISSALEFRLPSSSNAVIGEIITLNAEPGDTLGLISQRQDLGYVEMAEANPDFDPDRALSPGTEVTVPASYVLPTAPRHGIIINLAELRLYYFPPNGGRVITYPVGIGREGWETPVGATKISSKEKNPVWRPTKAVRQDAAAQGYYLPVSVPPGPDNPLGHYALRLGGTSYLIHSTNKPEGVGRRSSAGCMRMYPEDAAFLFQHVPVGTPVYIVNQPYKAGWQGNKLFVEAHVPLQEDQANDGSDLAPLVHEVLRVAKQRPGYRVDWDAVKKVGEEQNGVPTVVGYSGAAFGNVSADANQNQQHEIAVQQLQDDRSLYR